VPRSIYPDASQVEDAYRQPSMRVFEEVHPESNWTLQFAQGNAGRIMVGESRKADLLVLGAREHRGIERLLVGSVGHYGLNHASCPVVSVPAPEHNSDQDAPDPTGQSGSTEPEADVEMKGPRE
jgi:Universal stress protein family